MLNLQEARRQQGEQAAARQFFQANPDYLLGGGQTLGTMGAGGGPGAITQGPLPGQAGQAQTLGAPPDLSQHASGMPPATIGTMGQPPRQDPLRALFQTNPDAALQVMDMRTKVQTQVLGMQEKKLAAFGQILQGATDQASWDQAREQIGRVDPQAAARMPQQFNKEVRDQWVQQALSVKDMLTLQVQDLQAQAALMKARREQANIPNYTGDAQLDALIYVKMKDQPPGTMPSREIIDAAYQQREADKLRVQKAGATPQIVEGEGGVKYAVDPHTLERRAIPGGPPGSATSGPSGTTTAEPMRGPMSADDKKIADYADRMAKGQEKLTPLEDSGDYTSWKAPVANLPGGRIALSEKQQAYETAKAEFLQGLLRRDSQGQISAQEWADYSRTYFPQPGEGPEIVKQKQAMREGVIRAQQAVLGRPGVPQTQPTSQRTTGGTASTAWLATMAKKYNISLDEAKKKAAAAGVKVE